MEEIKTNKVEIKMTFKTEDEANKIGEIIHENLAGNQDYINSAILLNIADKVVTLVIGDEASHRSKMYASCLVSVALSSIIE